MMPTVRNVLTQVTGVPAHFVWCLRMDPNIAEVYGEPEWFATKYRDAFDDFLAAGDELGVHPHNWRWDDGWVGDHDDAEWIAYCSAVGRGAFRHAFGEDCRVYRHGDGYMSNRLLAQIDDAGVRVDLTIEPGRPAKRGLKDDEATRGWLPDLRVAPRHAFHPSRHDFRVPDPSRPDGLLMLPLTPGVITRLGASGAIAVDAAAGDPLVLWGEPSQFLAGLEHRLRQGDCSHLAFGLHSQAGADPDLWHAVMLNLVAVCGALAGRVRWTTATEAAELIRTG